jgi:hypothetical protein
VFDVKIGGRRLSSAAFEVSSDPGGGMSVDLQTQIEEAGLDAKSYVTTPRWIGSVRFEAGALRNEAFMVGFDPEPDNPYHGQVWGAFTNGRNKRLSRICQWFEPIPDVQIW